ncbi:MAG: hypothetical protein LBD11_03805, partial [Candidatus Peribacteria bacterium]|nr:hypothetical protein [Candidatus Peribacteria bacterium]
MLGISFLVPLVVFKAPWLTVQQLSTDTFSPKAVVKGLFAQAGNDIQVQDQIDAEALDSSAQNEARDAGQQDAQSCISVGDVWSEEELTEGLQEVKGGGLVEDFGRYIGFGWKEFHPGNGSYALAKFFFPSSE